MKFKEIVDIILARVGEDIEDPDVEILPVIKNGINQAYLLLRSKADQRSDEYTGDYENPFELPPVVGDIIEIEHSKDGILGKHEYKQDANLLYIFTPLSKGKLTIKHVVLPEKLVNDDDVIDLKELYIPAVIAYGAYSYQLYRRKYSSAQLLLAEFNSYMNQPNITV